MTRLLAAVFTFCAVSAMAGEGSMGVDQTGIKMPPPGYQEPIFVDAQGCTYVRVKVGDWIVWVQQLDARDLPDCDPLPGAGTPGTDLLTAQNI